jgi:hypothetical protein
MQRVWVKKLMTKIKFINFIKVLTSSTVVIIIAFGLMTGSAIASENEVAAVAFPDKYMVRLGTYIVESSDTQFSVTSDVGGIGTVIDFQRDLGGESGDTIPRIDAYYRFNPRHRIDFTAFSIDRKGTRTLTFDPPVIIDGVEYADGLINSDIKYTLYKVGYVYSFYHNDKVELGISAGINITNYDISLTNNVDKFESVGFTSPLPMFGLRMGYAITPKWSVHLVVETFLVDFDNTVKGTLLNNELNTEYRLFKNFALGAGVARISKHADISDDNWNGSVSDSYRGFTVFGTFYF